MEGSARRWLEADQQLHRSAAEQIAANLSAARLVDALADDPDRALSDEEGQQLAAFRSWGAGPVASVFDQRDGRQHRLRSEVEDTLGVERLAAAQRTVLNAHYTDLRYADAMWRFATAMGFEGGRVLEPGCGSGVFMASAPPPAEMVGVELDPVSAEVARLLNPAATIHQGSFADVSLPPSFDMVIGNVPFGNSVPSDRRYNPHGELSLHNYFLVKGLHLTAPGGLLVALTSRWTMDAQNPAARTAMAELADFVGALRLPSGAHTAMAGTEAVTDLVILRRRPDGAAVDEQARAQWLAPVRAAELQADPAESVGEIKVHPYFLDNPAQVLGTLGVGHGLYGRSDLVVHADSTDPEVVAEDLNRQLSALAADTRERFAIAVDHPATQRSSRVAIAPQTELVNDRIVRTTQGPTPFGQVRDGEIVPFEAPAAHRRELEQLLGLRDTVTTLLKAEAASMADTVEMQHLRTELNHRYDNYLRRYGPLNRFKVIVTKRTDPETGEAIIQRRPAPVMRSFRQDPHAAAVLALERFDEATQHAAKAEIFTGRVVMQRQPRRGADTPAEAVAICLDTDGEVTLSRLAELLGEPEESVAARCDGEVFYDPVTNGWMSRAEYLSGDLAERIEVCNTAIATNDTMEVPVEQYLRQIEELTAALPQRLSPEEISVRLGAVWVSADDVEKFLTETLDDAGIRVVHAGGSKWEVKGGQSYGVAATVEWGTERIPAPALAKRLLCQSPIEVRDEVPGPEGGSRMVLNPTETLLAQEKADALNEAFAEWVWSDVERRERLCNEYNRRFNSLVLRSYDGKHLSLPGLAATFSPRPHQRAAVARMISEPAVGLFHEVGAGKTAEMVMGCMELRRLGLVTKPAVVVPNHMLEQFQREWLQLYPHAKLLAASTQDLAGDKRARFTARAATGDWDGIILTRGSFKRLDVSHDTIRRYTDDEMTLLRSQKKAIDDAGLSVKQLEGQIAAAEERLKRRLESPRDAGVTFEETGIDYLCVDELHDYKNLTTASTLPGAAIQGSMRATDLHMKLHYLRRTHGNRVITGATATPIANSMSEAYVTQRYLRPDLLEAAGLVDFDTWAATFGQVTSALEFTPAGTLKLRARFARFVNVPELLRMWHMAADVKTAEDLNLPTPPLRVQPDGERGAETVVLPRPDALAVYMDRLGERAAEVSARPQREEDNILVITGDGRRAALDLRLLGPGEQTWLQAQGYAPDEVLNPGKVEAAADRIAQIWEDHRDEAYLDAAGRTHPNRGALQLVFCDLGTPGTEWNVYSALRDELISLGLPEGSVRFIHEAKNDTEKARLFEACRAGQVAVIIGSTQKMGVGTNIQSRAVALHHLDCPWRPADIAQRDGRVVRQGNQNPEVEVIRYVTERSFDAALWDTIARKAHFIGQVMKGRLDVREIDDVGEASLDAAQVAAAVSGDSRLLVKAQLESEVARLTRLSRAHSRSQQGLADRIETLTNRIPGLQADAARAGQLLEDYRPTAGDNFNITLHDGPQLRERADAVIPVHNHVRQVPWRSLPEGHEQPLCTVGNLPLVAQGVRLGVSAASDPAARIIGRVSIAGLPNGPAVDLTAGSQYQPNPGLVKRLENLAARIVHLPTTLADEAASAEAELARARDQHRQPFKHADLLAEKSSELRVLSAELMAEAEGHDEDSPESDTSAATAAEPDRPQVSRPHPEDFPTPDHERTTHTGRPVAWQQPTTTSKGSHHDR